MSRLAGMSRLFLCYCSRAGGLTRLERFPRHRIKEDCTEIEIDLVDLGMTPKIYESANPSSEAETIF